MAKFKAENVNAQEVKTGIDTGETFATIEKGKDHKGQQTAAGKDEQARRKSQLKTQGRKNCKTDRMCLAITPENLDFVRTMAKVDGVTMSRFINNALDAYRDAHKDQYNQIKELRF